MSHLSSLPLLLVRTRLLRFAAAVLLGWSCTLPAFAQTAPRLVAWDPPVTQPSTAQPSVQAPSAVSAASQGAIHVRRSGQACWDEAARYHGLDPWLLYAVAYVESTHNPGVISKPNRNGTYDIGLMQVNSVHLPRLSRYGITQATLMDACASTYVGAWIMADNIRRYGWSWQAIAAYNVGSLNTPARATIGRRYAGKVYAAYAKLSRQHAVSGIQASTR